jgi:tetratricopeptide (TPR) repeat protein
MGLAYEALGDTSMAKTFFEKSAATPSSIWRPSESAFSNGSEILYYRACAAQKLGRPAEAARIFDSLIKSGQDAVLSKGSGRPDYFAKFGEKESREVQMAQGHYVLGLGYLGSGKRQEARAELEQSVKLNVNHLDAQFQLLTISGGVN